jgi:hypothetical protein
MMKKKRQPKIEKKTLRKTEKPLTEHTVADRLGELDGPEAGQRVARAAAVTLVAVAASRTAAPPLAVAGRSLRWRWRWRTTGRFRTLLKAINRLNAKMGNN